MKVDFNTRSGGQQGLKRPPADWSERHAKTGPFTDPPAPPQSLGL